MVEDGLLKKADGVTPHFYHLKSHKKAYNIFNYQHEKICADIYVALFPYLREWLVYYDEDFTEVGLKPDRRSVIGSLAIAWEIDRSTMVRQKIKGKIDKYIQYAKKYNRKFIVVFACSDRRAKSLIRELQDFRSHFVLVYTVDYKELIKNPTGEGAF